MTTPPDPNAILLGADPVPICATPDERALLEWAAANPLHKPHPGMSKDGSRYMAPHPTGADTKNARTRVTTFCEALDDGQGLVRWRHRILVRGLFAGNVALPALNGEIIDDAAVDRAIGKALHDGGEKLKADIGTALHLACEHHVAGTGIRPPAPWGADVDAFAAMLATHRLDVKLSEAILWVPVGDGLCGTADLLVAGPWGDDLRIVDIKTGSSTDRIGYACQLAVYSRSTHRWTEAGWEPMPAIDQSTGYIAHLPAGSSTCSLVAVELDHSLVDLAVILRRRRRQAAVSAMFTTVDVPASLFDAAPAEVDDPQSTSADQPEAPRWLDAPIDDVRAWIVGRVQAVAAVDKGAIARAWPDGVATKAGEWSVPDVVALDLALAPLEARYGVEPPFPPMPPVVAEVPAEPEPDPHYSLWPIDEGGEPGSVDRGEGAAVAGAFLALDDERKALAVTWAGEGKRSSRPWAVSGDALTPRTLAIYRAVVACVSAFWDSDGAADCDLMTRAALSIVIGEDVRPAWTTGGVIGSLSIDQAARLDRLASRFVLDDEDTTGIGAKALALAV